MNKRIKKIISSPLLFDLVKKNFPDKDSGVNKHKNLFESEEIKKTAQQSI